MYLLIDHNDSFVYNLKSYFEVLNCSVKVITCEGISPEHIAGIETLQGIVLSPGPKHPEDYIDSVDILRAFYGHIPILGVCLGHQLIAYAFGSKVIKGSQPMHGKVSKINNYHTGLLAGLPEEFSVTRYHSLIVSEESLPNCFQIDARSEEGAIMAISHKNFSVFGVQFHPEAILSQYGYGIVHNFVKACEKRRI